MTPRSGLPFLVLLPWLVAGSVCRADDEPSKTAGRKIVVSASATVHVKPDAARLTFAVTTEVPNKAREDNDKQVKKVKDTLAALSLRNVDIQVLPQSLSTITTPGAGGGGVPPPQSQQAQSLFFVTVREKDPDKLKQMVARLSDAATENGGAAVAATADDVLRLPRRLGRGVPETVSGPKIEWLSENTLEARRRAIKQAVGDALASAQAAVGDAKLQVAEIHVSGPDDFRGALRSRITSASTPEAGLIPVTVSVQVTYSY